MTAAPTESRTGSATALPTDPYTPAPAREQQRLWALHQLEGPSTTDDLPVVLRLRGLLDPEALTSAWRDTLTRHPVLRTTYPEVGGVPVAREQPAVAVARLRRRPVRSPGDAWSAELAAAVDTALAPVRLAAEIPARATLLRLAPEEHVLVLSVHAIAADRRSVRPLLADLAEAYSIRRAGRRPDLTPAPPFVAPEERAEYRRELLAAPVGSGPLRPAATRRRTTVDRVLPEGVRRAVAGTDALAAAVAAVVAAEPGESVVDVRRPGRAPGQERAVGPYERPATVRCSSGWTPRELLRRVAADAPPADGPARTLVEHAVVGPLPTFDGVVAERDRRFDPDTGHEQVVTLREGPDRLALRLAVDAATCDAAHAATRVRRIADELERIVAR